MYTSQDIQQLFLTHMQYKEDMPMLGKDDNVSENFALCEDEKSTLEAQNIKRDYKVSVSKSLDRGRRARTGRTPQDGLLGSNSLSSLREVKFNKQEFPTGTLVSSIKYDHLESQNDNFFYSFYNQLDYLQAYYFIEFEITKDNLDQFLSNPFITPFTEKLSDQNADKQMEKLLEILLGIPNDKWIKHKFDLQSGVTRIAG